jgi:poly-gamma-glutamate synthesis protein (capsule biosynthesis protein)
VQLAEQANGFIPKPVDPSYIWGDALAVLADIKPDLRIINLETSVTTNDDFWPKGINYRMHPENIGCLSSASIDCCILANNHVLDWGQAGLVETLDVIKQAEMKSVGAGKDRKQAELPAIYEITGKGRLLIFAYGSPTSGVPLNWAATEDTPGVNVLPDLSDDSVLQIKKEVKAIKQPGDVVLFSIHWGGNWGYKIAASERRFAHKLIDNAGVDAIYGHSSHHVKGIELYQGKLILYGCGDFLNDYEGIRGYEHYRGDLSLMYFPSFDPLSGRLVRMSMMPMQIKRLQTVHTSSSDTTWLMKVLNREGKKLGTKVTLSKDGFLNLTWD